MSRTKATRPDTKHDFTDESTPPSLGNRKRTGRMIECPICGTMFYRTGSQLAKGLRVGCSRACGYKVRQLPQPSNFKGEECSYDSLHQWVRRHKGKPQKCVECGKTKDEGRIEWANISGTYRRDFDDWRELCVRCHRREDNKRKGHSREFFEVRESGSLGVRKK